MTGPHYHAPQELPSGFCERLAPLGQWVLQALASAYDDGYTAGRADAATLHCADLACYLDALKDKRLS